MAFETGKHAVLNRHSRLVDGLVRVVLLKALLRLDEMGARIRQSRVAEHIGHGLHGGLRPAYGATSCNAPQLARQAAREPRSRHQPNRRHHNQLKV